MKTDGWVSKETFAVYLANRIRRSVSEPNRELSVRIFSEEYGIPEAHIMRVLNFNEDPSTDLLEAVGAERQIRQETVYRFRR